MDDAKQVRYEKVKVVGGTLVPGSILTKSINPIEDPLSMRFIHVHIISYVLCFFSIIALAFSFIWLCSSKLSLAIFIAIFILTTVTLIVNLWIIKDTDELNKVSGNFKKIALTTATKELTPLVYRFFIDNILWRQMGTVICAFIFILWYINAPTYSSDDYYVFMSTVVTIVILALLTLLEITCRTPRFYF